MLAKSGSGGGGGGGRGGGGGATCPRLEISLIFSGILLLLGFPEDVLVNPDESACDGTRLLVDIVAD